MPNRRLAVTALAAAVVLAACNPTPSTAPASPSTTPGGTVAPPSSAPSSGVAPSPGSSSSADDAVYAAIREQVEAIRNLRQKVDIGPVTIDEIQLRENLEAEIDAQLTPEILSVSNDLLTTLGLIPEGSSLRDLSLDLLAGQVAGYYDPKRDELFVVSRSGQAVGPVERLTYAHEFTHQLQDQNFDLDSFDTSSIDQSDRALAQTALIEGDATLVQSMWIFQANFTPAELTEILGASQDPEAVAALEDAPLYLRDTSLFPYQDGLLFAQALSARPAGVDGGFQDPPLSTEQVLHPDKYFAGEAPVDVRIGAGIANRLGSGWKELGRDTLGELILRIWLEEHGLGQPRTGILDPPSAEAQKAVAGWGGDRLVLLRDDDGSVAIALSTSWDTAADADEFADAAVRALADPGITGELFHRAGSRDVLLALGARAADVLAALRG